MLLRSDLALHQCIPKEYDLDMWEDAKDVKNTFIFSEQDLPGFKSKMGDGFDPSTANLPPRLTQKKPGKPMGERQPFDRSRKFQPYVRRAIPKKTTLAGKVKHEVNCVAVDNAESAYLMAVRTMEAMKPKTTTLHATNESARFVEMGTVRDQDVFGGFIVSHVPRELYISKCCRNRLVPRAKQRAKI
jgi:transcription initiation factor TFIIF subunit beta